MDDQTLNSLFAAIKSIQAKLDTLYPHLLVAQETNLVAPEWIPKKDLMKFLNYGDTKIAELLNSDELVVSTIGKRKFVHKDSLNQLLIKNRK